MNEKMINNKNVLLVNTSNLLHEQLDESTKWFVFGGSASAGKTYSQIRRDVFNKMEKYLENIFNSPSTINRIVKYYHLASNINHPLKDYLIFEEINNEKAVIILEYDYQEIFNKHIKKWRFRL